MKDDPGAELYRALLHRTTHTRNKDPAILQCNMKQLQTSPEGLRAVVETHLFVIISMLYSLTLKSNETLDLHLVQADLNYSYDVSR